MKVDIFIQALQIVLRDHDFVPPSAQHPPVVLTQVCRLWRKIALSCPILWSSLDVTINCWYDLDRYREVIPLWISRSGNIPFSFRLLFSPNTGAGVHINQMYPVFKRLLDASTRWHIVQLIVRPESDNSDDLYYPGRHKYDFTALESLSFSAHPSVLKAYSQLLDVQSTTAPLLNTFRLDGDDILSPVPRYVVPDFGALNRLLLHNFTSLQDCIQVLQSCIRSTDITICLGDLMYPVHMPTIIHSPAVIPQLHSWKIRTFSGMTGLFDNFRIPNIQHLHVEFRWMMFENNDEEPYLIANHPPWPQEAFISFITRSACSITKLFFEDVHLSRGDLVDILVCVSSTLQELIIYGVGEPSVPCVDDEVLQLLTWKSETISNVCGHLWRICLIKCMRCRKGKFAQMVMSRHQTADASSLDMVEVKVGVRSGMDIDLREDFMYLKRSLGGVTVLSLYDRFGSPVTFEDSLDINTQPCSSVVQCRR